MLKDHFKNKIHGASLIEGKKEEILPQILEILEEHNFSIINNPDFLYLNLDTLKAEEARNFKEAVFSKSIKEAENSKRIFILAVNHFLHDAQNTLLKIFEDIKPNNHFFIITEDADHILPTLYSRLYVLRNNKDKNTKNENIKKFMQMSSFEKFNYIKELMKEEKDEISNHTKALTFLNSLESYLYELSEKDKNLLKNTLLFDQIFKARNFLRYPGSASKTLLESVVFYLPKIS